MKFNKTIEELASLAEKNLEVMPERAKADKRRRLPPYLWARNVVKDYLFRLLMKDYLFQLSVRIHRELAEKVLFKKYTANEQELNLILAPLRALVEETDRFVEAGEAFADDYSRELLIKFFAMRLGIVSGISLTKYITSTELALTRGDYLMWRLSLRKIVGGWKVLGFVFRGMLPEPPGLLYLHGVRERDILPDKNSVFVDVGAYIGDSALPMSCYFGKIFAFEPYGPNLKLLRENTKGANNVEIMPYALGDVEGHAEIVADTGRSTGTARIMGSRNGKIKISTIDKTLRSIDLGEYGTIKMDIEGYERKAIRGGKKTIREQLPQLVISAYHLPDDIPVFVDTIERISSEYSLYFRHHQRWAPTDFVVIARRSSA